MIIKYILVLIHRHNTLDFLSVLLATTQMTEGDNNIKKNGENGSFQYVKYTTLIDLYVINVAIILIYTLEQTHQTVGFLCN